MLNSKVKISIISALFSLLFLFPMVNFDLCCSASFSDDDSPETPQQEIKINDDETSLHVRFNLDNENDNPAPTTQTEEKHEEEETEANDPPTENDGEENPNKIEKTDDNSSNKSDNGDLCPFLCNIC